ncbi:cytochrome c oxidase assembly protein [Deinococcus gobiensis]|uniref:Cytochrome c oxidase assembly protein n=1 Tax=Deinococcus gobiensis (strain DSM 21396 / JCM 16679 / CGMCC 1.7299 / I-0) TaxID=745776 RepID=H8H0V6_DEIGI|nr:cytochrome c oxidase assembly protein [Deinococcus gobiensis]AFD26975.1 hypothetical protein DGo_PA0089 [Deinococcus gobiensis I-0]
MNRPVLPRLWLAGAALATLGALALYASGAAAAPWSFSRHMGAHLLLSLAAAPLLVAAWPAPRRPRVGALPGFLILNAVTYGLHLPSAAHALMTPAGLGLEAALFLGAGLLFWLAAARGGPAAAVLLLAQMAACALLGAAITFSRGAYPMTAPADTALGGVLMWVAGGLVVMAAAFAVLIGLLARSSAKESHEQLL